MMVFMFQYSKHTYIEKARKGDMESQLVTNSAIYSHLPCLHTALLLYTDVPPANIFQQNSSPMCSIAGIW
jgi:hypothetical protein